MVLGDCKNEEVLEDDEKEEEVEVEREKEGKEKEDWKAEEGDEEKENCNGSV